MDPAPQTQYQPTDADSPENFANDYGSKHSRGLPKRKYASAHRDDSEAIEYERGRIIRKPFAFENDEDPPGELHSASNRERRHHIRRRNNGAQYEADWPG